MATEDCLLLSPPCQPNWLRETCASNELQLKASTGNSIPFPDKANWTAGFPPQLSAPRSTLRSNPTDGGLLALRIIPSDGKTTANHALMIGAFCQQVGRTEPSSTFTVDQRLQSAVRGIKTAHYDFARENETSN